MAHFLKEIFEKNNAKRKNAEPKEIIKEILSFDEAEYEGYKVITNNSVYEILIGNTQKCCEEFGQLCTDDNLLNYLGAELINIDLTNTLLQNINVNDFLKDYGTSSEQQIQFVTFKTDRGDFQLAVYNFHNGYYGHEIKIIKNKAVLKDEVL